jgi:hypothetical protein
VRKLVAVLTIGAFLALGGTSTTAQAHWKPGFHNQLHGVVWGFCGGKDSLTSPCRYGREALVVARLESSSFWWDSRCQEAGNGQYLGCFQMGSSERDTYGHANNVWGQARAAYRYFRASGYDWSPWSCKPGGYCIDL